MTDFLDRRKVRVSSQEDSEKLQELAFNLGYEWDMSGRIFLQNRMFFFGSHEKGRITRTDSANYFEKHASLELAPDFLHNMDYEEIRIQMLMEEELNEC